MTQLDERFNWRRDYVESKRSLPLSSREHEAETLLRRLGKLADLNAGDSLLELGCGGGWMLVLAAKRGLRCTGVEHNPELVEVTRDLAKREGVEVDVRLGSAETYPLEPGAYDFAIANSLLEHVPDYRSAIANVYRALRPGGVFNFNSTNKFALRSGEYPPLRLYGWLPYALRARIRVAKQGPDVITSGRMDANQFTYPGLRRTLHAAGFSRVLDIYQLLDVGDLNHRTLARTAAMRAYKAIPPLKTGLSTFSDGTYFYCLK